MKTLQLVSSLLAKWTPGFVTATAVAAYFAPDVFGWVRGYSQTAVLGVIMLTMGMTLKSEDFKVLFSRPLDMAIGTVAQFALMPTIAWALVTCWLVPGGSLVQHHELSLQGRCGVFSRHDDYLNAYGASNDASSHALARRRKH